CIPEVVKDCVQCITTGKRSENCCEENHAANSGKFVPFGRCFSKDMKISSGTNQHELLKPVHFVPGHRRIYVNHFKIYLKISLTKRNNVTDSIMFNQVNCVQVLYAG